MNVYDFDKTIYAGDSTIDFYMYCLRKHPIILILFPKQIIGLLGYKLKIIEKTKCKECFFCFVKILKNVDLDIECFWDEHQYKIKKWYYEIRQDTDVVISASPYFLLNGICSKIGVAKLLASNVDKKTGMFLGANCYGEEKVKRFYEEYPNQKIERFYSDSCSDSPLANIANQSFIVKKNKLIPWGAKGK